MWEYFDLLRPWLDPNLQDNQCDGTLPWAFQHDGDDDDGNPEDIPMEDLNTIIRHQGHINIIINIAIAMRLINDKTIIPIIHIKWHCIQSVLRIWLFIWFPCLSITEMKALSHSDRRLVDEVVPWWVAATAGWGTSTLQYVFNNVGEEEAMMVVKETQAVAWWMRCPSSTRLSRLHPPALQRVWRSFETPLSFSFQISELKAPTGAHKTHPFIFVF